MLRSRVFSILQLSVLIGSISSFSSTISAFAAEGKKQTSSNLGKEDIASLFRCEKIRDAKLAELKLAMIENCDLNKVFSIAATDVAVNTSYIYCCHTLRTQKKSEE